MRRVFTHQMWKSLVLEGAAWVTDSEADVWTVQEDILIVGVAMQAEICTQSENDGIAGGYGRLYHGSPADLHSLILIAKAFELWNTAPPFGGIEAECREIMLPAGLAIPIKEEGSITLQTHTTGKSAGSVSWSVGAVIFYVKKSVK
ncbi:hypothetical protein ES705_49455 [subsurface metagenome]